jgi:hypothetical protein
MFIDHLRRARRSLVLAKLPGLLLAIAATALTMNCAQDELTFDQPSTTSVICSTTGEPTGRDMPPTAMHGVSCGILRAAG